MKKPIFVIFALLIFSNILAWSVVRNLNEQKFLEVVFFDVGQGDAIFIEDHKGHQVLIDGGPDSTILEKLNQEMPFWDRSLDLIILTHPEKDHMSGLIEVLKRYDVEYVLWTGVIRDTSEYKKWKNILADKEIVIKTAKIGQKITLQSSDLYNIFIEILYPLENLKGQEFKNNNNTSIVSRLVFNETSFLFPGDIYKSVENKLIDEDTYIDSDVLKISHHGSKTSTSENFIKEVSPQIAVIQVGKNNSYGHPRQETLTNLEKFGIKILRTDKQGDIKIISNGKNIKITK